MKAAGTPIATFPLPAQDLRGEFRWRFLLPVAHQSGEPGLLLGLRKCLRDDREISIRGLAGRPGPERLLKLIRCLLEQRRAFLGSGRIFCGQCGGLLEQSAPAVVGGDSGTETGLGAACQPVKDIGGFRVLSRTVIGAGGIVPQGLRQLAAAAFHGVGVCLGRVREPAATRTASERLARRPYPVARSSGRRARMERSCRMRRPGRLWDRRRRCCSMKAAAQTTVTNMADGRRVRRIGCLVSGCRPRGIRDDARGSSHPPTHCAILRCQPAPAQKSRAEEAQDGRQQKHLIPLDVAPRQRSSTSCAASLLR